MPSMASITIIGHTAAEPEFAENRAKLRVAVNGRRSGEKTTTWFDVTVWGKGAEFLATLAQEGKVGRGALVAVQGDLEARSWTGKDGQQRTNLEISANRVMALAGESAPSEPPF